jgi:hypothetical protein
LGISFDQTSNILGLRVFIVVKVLIEERGEGGIILVLVWYQLFTYQPHLGIRYSIFSYQPGPGAGTDL